MINVTIKRGLSGRLTLQFPEGTTVRQVISDNRVKSALDLPENVSVLIDGEEIDFTETVESGDVLEVERAQCEKGA